MLQLMKNQGLLTRDLTRQETKSWSNKNDPLTNHSRPEYHESMDVVPNCTTTLLTVSWKSYHFVERIFLKYQSIPAGITHTLPHIMYLVMSVVELLITKKPLYAMFVFYKHFACYILCLLNCMAMTIEIFN